jgi:hypothetical protein
MPRAERQVVPEVGRFLSQDDGESALDLLPALEQIELRTWKEKEFISESLLVVCASTLDTFDPFVAAQQRVSL